MKNGTLILAVIFGLTGCITYLPMHPDDSYEMKKSSNIQLPKSCPQIASNYGDQMGVNGGLRKSPHDGIDMKVAVGTDVIAAQKGKVIIAGFIQCGGNMIWVDHGRNKAGNAILSSYLHLSKIGVKVGDNISQGDIIGLSGVSGSDECTTGTPHLHFEMKAGDNSVKPFDLSYDWPLNVGRVSPHGFWATSSTGEVAHMDSKTGKIDASEEGFIFPLKCN